MNDHVLDLIARRADGRLRDRDEARVVEHLRSCATCRSFEARLPRYDALIASGRRVHVAVRPFPKMGARRVRSTTSLTVAAAAIGVAVLAVAVVAPALFGGREFRSLGPVPVAALQELTLPSGVLLPSPSGALLAVRAPSEVALFDLDGREVARHAGEIEAARWQPSGNQLLVTLRSGDASRLATLDQNGLRPMDVSLPRDTYTATSPDGSAIAAKIAPREIAVIIQGEIASRISVSESALLLGWDADGAIIIREGEMLRALSRDGAEQWNVGLPPSLGRDPRAALSPDRSVAIVAGTGGAWAIRQRALWPVPQLDWIGGHDLLLRHADGTLASLDTASGATREIPYALAAGASVRAATDGYVVVSPDAGDLIVVQLATGRERTLSGFRRSNNVFRLATSRFLVPGSPVRIIDAAVAFR
jgi:hypothetical protein